MKIKNKGYIIGIISILVLASSISIFVPFISNHVSKHSKNSMLDFKKEYSPIRGGMTGDNNQATQSLIKRLSSVVEYVTNSVIPKQNKLKCSILGGTDDSGVNHKKSELASFNSKTWIGKNRYSKETNATISNSVQRLKDEDKKINTIISIIKIHPYTYQAYLNKDGIIIPNIDFFINNENSITNLKSSKISNNLYTIGNTNPSINSVSLATEEATFSAKAISKSGMSLTRAVFSNISFTAKIITFNTKINGFQFASTTTIKDNYKSTANTMIPSSNSLNTKNSEFIGTTSPFRSDLFYLSSNRVNLSKSLSRNNTLLTNSDAVSASNYSSYNIIFGIANINYNGVSQFRYNKLLYSLLIVYPLVIAPFIFHISVGMSLLTIEFIDHKLNKRIKKNVNAPDNPLIPPVDRHTDIPPIIFPIANDDVGVRASGDTGSEEERIPTPVINDETSKELVVRSDTDDVILPIRSAEAYKWLTQKNKVLLRVNALTDRCFNKKDQQEDLTADKIEEWINTPWNEWIKLDNKVKNNGELSQDGDIQMLRQESELLHAKLTDILKYRDELIRRLDEANANRSDSVDTLPKANINNSKATDEAIDDTIDDASTNAGSSTHSNVLKTPANDSSTVIDPSNTNDVLKESDSINDETNDYLMGRPLQQSKVISAEHTGRHSILFWGNEQKNIIPIVMLPNPETETKAVPPMPSLPIIPTPEPTIPKQSAPLPRIARTDKTPSPSVYRESEIGRITDNLNILDSNLNLLEKNDWIGEKTTYIANNREILEKTKTDMENFSKSIEKENFTEKIKYRSRILRLFDKRLVLESRLSKLELESALPAKTQQAGLVDKDLGTTTSRLNTREEITNNGKMMVNGATLKDVPITPIREVRLVETKADSPIEIAKSQWMINIMVCYDDVSRVNNEFIHDNIESILLNREEYEAVKVKFINKVTTFLNDLRNPVKLDGVNMEEFTEFVKEQANIISQHLKNVLEELARDEIAYIKNTNFNPNTLVSDLKNIREESKQKINTIQRDIKLSIFELSKEIDSSKCANISVYKERIQNNINKLEEYLKTGIVDTDYKRAVRKKIPQMKELADKWTEIRNESSSVNNYVIDPVTGIRKQYVRTFENKENNIMDDLITVFGTDI